MHTCTFQMQFSSLSCSAIDWHLVALLCTLQSLGWTPPHNPVLDKWLNDGWMIFSYFFEERFILFILQGKSRIIVKALQELTGISTERVAERTNIFAARVEMQLLNFLEKGK